MTARMQDSLGRADRIEGHAGAVVFCLVIGLGLGCGAPPSEGRQPTAETAMAGNRIGAFEDVTDAAGITFKHHNGQTGTCRYPEIMGGGVALFDFDGDQFLDIYFVNGNDLGVELSPEFTNVLYRNQGDGTFVDVTIEAGVGDISYGQGCCVGDVDNDGDQDLYVTNFGANRLYLNNGDGTFSDQASAAGVGDDAWGQACEFLDVDNDGRLDIYVQNYLTYSLDDKQETRVVVKGASVRDYVSPALYPGAPDLLYRNLGDGTFEDVARSVGLFNSGGKGMGAAWADFDLDSHGDLFVANDGMENYYFINSGAGTFQENATALGLAFDATGAGESSMGVAVGDVNGDGRLDLIVPTIRRQGFTFYQNEGGFFRDASLEHGLKAATIAATGFSPHLMDVDHDGDLDLFVTCGGVRTNSLPTGDGYDERYGMADLLLVNDGMGNFHHGGIGAHSTRLLTGRGSAAGDIDNDGDLDLVINNLDGPAVVLFNRLRNEPTGDHHWLLIDLNGRSSNRDGVGAIVEVQTGDLRQIAAKRGGGSYLSANDGRLHFGLGGHTQLDRITVRWPSGVIQELTNVPSNQVLVIEEGQFASQLAGARNIFR